MIDRERVKALVREKVLEKLNLSQRKGVEENTETSICDFVSEKEIERARGGVLWVTPKAIITPLARDIAERKGIEIRPVQQSSCDLTKERKISNPRAVAIGADHGGFEMKQLLIKHIQSLGYEVVDLGTNDTSSVDYPDFAHAVAKIVASGDCARGIIIDGAGIGSSIAANKVPGIRAAHCSNQFEVKNSREHNDANILALGGRVIGIELAKEMVKLWLETSFEGGRHKKRVDKISAIEKQYRARL